MSSFWRRLTGILFGLAPALGATRSDLAVALKGAPGIQRGQGRRLGPGKLLIAAQVAVSCILLAGTGLFVRSLWNLSTVAPGFDPENLLLLRASVAGNGPKGAARNRLFEDALERIESLPGVRSASLSTESLFQGNSWTEAVVAPGYQPRRGEDRDALILVVAPKFFATMGTQLLGGRDFDRRDDETFPRTAIVNEAMARYYFPGRDPIGQHFGFDAPRLRGPIEIVGLVKDAKYKDLRRPAPRIVYLPQRQMPGLGMATIEVRTSGPPEKMTDTLWREVQASSPYLRASGATTQRQLVDGTIVADRLLATLSVAFGIVAAILVSIGLYGITAYAVSRRTTEVGIRLALGSRRGDVLRLILGETLAIVVGGIATGLAAALFATRLAGSLLFGVTSSDPAALAAAVALLACVAAAAAYLPARRAARIDPAVALRHE